jgi:hypothetical protein
MTTLTTGRLIIPNPRIPTTIGTLNIVFGVILLLFGLGTIAWSIAAPPLLRSLQARTAEIRAEQKAEREQKLAQLRAKEKAETSADRRVLIQEEIADLEAEIDLEPDEIFDVSADPRIIIPGWIDTIASLLLNALLVASGAGLLALRPWGRKTALGVAGAKIALASFTLAYALIVTIPIAADQARVQFLKMEARQRGTRMAPVGFGGSSATGLAQIAAASAAVSTVAAFAFTVAYPAIILWLLNKPSARAALIAGPTAKPSPGKLPSEPDAIQ